MKPICEANDCEKLATGNKIYCRAHYMRWWRCGDANRVKFTMPHVQTGSRRFLTKNDMCTVDMCDTPMLPGGARGMCTSHYNKWRKYGDPNYEREPIPTDCSISECDNPRRHGDGLCSQHHYRLVNYGDVNYVRPPGRMSHPLYTTWSGMRNRCNNPASTSYPLYGGRGIYVCERWNNLETGFENFVEDMGSKPEGTSLDRIDNNGPYSPDNCRWATHVQQQNNKTTNTLVEFNGIIKTMAEWGRVSGVDPSVIQGRIRMGWKLVDAIHTPVHIKGTPKARYSA